MIYLICGAIDVVEHKQKADSGSAKHIHPISQATSNNQSNMGCQQIAPVAKKGCGGERITPGGPHKKTRRVQAYGVTNTVPVTHNRTQPPRKKQEDNIDRLYKWLTKPRRHRHRDGYYYERRRRERATEGLVQLFVGDGSDREGGSCHS